MLMFFLTDTNASVVWKAQQLDNLYMRRRKLKVLLMLKILNGMCRNTEYNFRNNQFKLNLPKPRTNYFK